MKKLNYKKVFFAGDIDTITKQKIIKILTAEKALIVKRITESVELLIAGKNADKEISLAQSKGIKCMYFADFLNDVQQEINSNNNNPNKDQNKLTASNLKDIAKQPNLSVKSNSELTVFSPNSELIRLVKDLSTMHERYLRLPKISQGIINSYFVDKFINSEEKFVLKRIISPHVNQNTQDKHLSHKKEWFSYDLFQFMASASGLICLKSNRQEDFEGTDLKIQGHTKDDVEHTMRLQVKCVSSKYLTYKKDCVSYNGLEPKVYERLRINHQTFILIIVAIPNNIIDTPDLIDTLGYQGILIHAFIYWLSLKHYKKKKNKTSITVHIPKTNRIDTPKELRRVFEASYREEL